MKKLKKRKFYGRKKPQGLKWEKGDYTPLSLELTRDIKDVRKEYSRLRAIWNKRYKRLIESEYKDINVVYDRPAKRYKKLSDVKSDRELFHLLSELGTIVGSGYTSVSGLKKLEKERMEQLNKTYEGLNLKTHEDFKNFGEFMESIRNFAKDRIYDSDFAAVLYSEGENLSIQELVELYHEFLKTGSRKVSKLKADITKRKNIKAKQKRQRRKRRKRR